MEETRKPQMDSNTLLIGNEKHLENVFFNSWHAARIPILTILVLFLVCYHLIGKRKAVSRHQKDVLVKNESQKKSLISQQEKATTVLSASKSPASEPAPHTVRRSLQNDVPEKVAPKRVAGRRPQSKRTPTKEVPPSDLDFQIQPLVFYSSLTGTTETAAQKCSSLLDKELLNKNIPVLPVTTFDLSYIDYDDYFVAIPKPPAGQHIKYFYLLLIPTYNIDTVLNTFLDHLQETHHDFRIDTAPLSNLVGYSVFGFGDREGWPTEEEGFCSQAKEIDRWLAKLTNKKRAFPLGLGDVKSDSTSRLEEWLEGVTETISTIADTKTLGEGVQGSGEAVESSEEDEEEELEVDLVDMSKATRPQRTFKNKKHLERSDIGDLEDLGRKVPKSADEPSIEETARAPLAIDFTTSKLSFVAPQIPAPKPMVPVSSPTHAALTKQGYTIIGSHSGVKICRWTKSALRGRGSCYKYSFYGIASHLCMETTPSLSCSNKCVFCWRHGTNPVGTTWRWQVDPPELIFQGAKEAHIKKIKVMKGVPGVRADRFQEAMRIRHCALSLVGEPIFYPHINEFVGMLHKEHISSFLVCNAQHPDQLAALKVVTQLYVSIDASNRDSLRKVDRPLHRDFWERFLRCLDIIRERRNRMRTVYRLTLVKGFNIDDEAEGYADLVARGLPCFVEIKGVTYCGTSTSASAGLTMQNVPFYEEVTAFVIALNDALAKRGLNYGIAAEHAHSCCVLLASESFRKEGKWHTIIDYEKFFQLLESGEEFTPEDYMGRATPDWATWGNGGFDPRDVRVDRKGRPKEDVPKRIVEI